jgi:hypothetical protein
MPRTHTNKQQLAHYAESRRRSHAVELEGLKRENVIMRRIVEIVQKFKAASNGHAPLIANGKYNHCHCGVAIHRASKHCMLHRIHPRAAKLLALAILLCLNLPALAQSYKFQWDPSPSATNQVIGYRLYASTNSLTYDTRMTAPIRLDAGTNTTAQVTNALTGTYWFYATAYNTNQIESVLSDPLVVTVPVYAPKNLRTVFLQWNATVTGTNWIDTGFFRIKFGD